MEPAYERGDVALLRPVDAADLEINDVIKFELRNRAVVHRIVAIEEGPDGIVITTKGDASDRPDPPIPEEAVEGRVVFLLPEVGHLNLWLRSLF